MLIQQQHSGNTSSFFSFFFMLASVGGQENPRRLTVISRGFFSINNYNYRLSVVLVDQALCQPFMTNVCLLFHISITSAVCMVPLLCFTGAASSN